MLNTKKDFQLLNYNTFRIQANASFFVEYDSEQDLMSFLSTKDAKLPYLQIGKGSNLLIMGDINAYVLYSKILGIEQIQSSDKEVILKVGAGVIWDNFVEYCVNNDLYGAENLSFIPGQVGASAIQNIGAYGVEAKDIIYAVETIDSNCNKKVYKNDECAYSYRHSIFKEVKSIYNNPIITYVYYKLKTNENYHLDYGNLAMALKEKNKSLSIKNVRNTIIEIRENKLPNPNIIGSAGSFFMNPIISKQKLEKLKLSYPNIPWYKIENNYDSVKISAAWLIDKCNWKGKSLGPASVYDKQALVIINNGGAKGNDILALANAILSSVSTTFNINLEMEVIKV